MKGIIKNIIIIIVVIILIMIAYFVFFKKNSGVTPTGLANVAGVSSQPDQNAVGDAQITSQEFLTQLLAINSVNINDTLTANPAFAVLQDFIKPIPPDNNPGRSNPFAPLGADVTAVSTQVSTGSISNITANSAVLSGSIILGGKNITRWFEYGPTTDLGTKTPVRVQAVAGNFTETIIGLDPSSVYYVKAFASLGGQVVSGSLYSFTTAAPVPTGQ